MKLDISIWYEIFTFLLAACILGTIGAAMKESNGYIIAGVIVTLLIIVVWLIIIHFKDASSAE